MVKHSSSSNHVWSAAQLTHKKCHDYGLRLPSESSEEIINTLHTRTIIMIMNFEREGRCEVV